MNEFSLTNDPASLARLQRQLEAVLQSSDIRPKIISAVNLALGEWIENIIQHAYVDGASHPISVHCQVGPACVTVRVIDDGRPFNPCDYPEMNAAEASRQSAFSGRGIHLIRHLVDGMKYERQDGRNVLHLTRNFA